MVRKRMLLEESLYVDRFRSRSKLRIKPVLNCPAALAAARRLPRRCEHAGTGRRRVCKIKKASQLIIACKLHSGSEVQTTNSFADHLIRKLGSPSPLCIDDSHRQQASFPQRLCSFDVCVLGALAFAFISFLLVDFPSREKAGLRRSNRTFPCWFCGCVCRPTCPTRPSTIRQDPVSGTERPVRTIAPATAAAATSRAGRPAPSTLLWPAGVPLDEAVLAAKARRPPLLLLLLDLPQDGQDLLVVSRRRVLPFDRLGA